MSSKHLRVSFVVTISAATVTMSAGCTKDKGGPATANIETGAATDTSVAHGEPDPPKSESSKVEVSTDPEAFHVRDADRGIEWSAYPETLNAKDEEGRTVYRSDRGCHVNLPFDEPPRSWQPPPTQELECPPPMRSAHWSHCSFGTLHAKADRSECLCAMDGNPPPPPRLLDCPPK